MKVWYDSEWSWGKFTYSSILNVTTCLKLPIVSRKSSKRQQTIRKGINMWSFGNECSPKFALVHESDEVFICWDRARSSLYGEKEKEN
jgi:hypothetical protein